jgi:hypothetical protein
MEHLPALVNRVASEYHKRHYLEELLNTTKASSGWPMFRLRFETSDPPPPEYRSGVLPL